MADTKQLLADKDFLAAPQDEQIKYLSAIDPDFAKASKGDQVGYLNHVTGGTRSANIEANAFKNLPSMPAPLPSGLRGEGSGQLIDPFSGSIYDAAHPADVNLKGAAQNLQEANLAHKAKTGRDLPGYTSRQFMANVGADADALAHSAISPASAGIAALMSNPVTGIP